VVQYPEGSFVYARFGSFRVEGAPMSDEQPVLPPDLDLALPRTIPPLVRPLKFLSDRQIALIDRALSDIGPFGEVRLVKAKGRLRFIQRLDSEDAP